MQLTEQPMVIEAAEEDTEEPLGEFQVAEYIIFILALDTYMRYAEETSGIDDIEDQVIHKGMRILRMAETEIERLQAFLQEHLETTTQRSMLRRALTMTVTTTTGISRRSLQFRTLLSRGGPATIKGIFTSQKYIRQVREAITASTLSDADAALDVFAALPIKNARMRNWIDVAAKQAGSGIAAPAPVDNAANEVVAAPEITNTSLQGAAASGASDAKEAQDSRAAMLSRVQVDATEAARKSLEINQQPDTPPNQSEVVGIATAAAVAAISDPLLAQNVPAPLCKLDDEQRAAAVTDGKVLVAAGAGAGKSTTLVARIEYLTKIRRVLPSRILATSFNKKAASELKEKIGRTSGGDALTQMSVGTMHGLFRKFIGSYGTTTEQIAVGVSRGLNGFVEGGSSVARTVQRMWEECYGKDEPVPKLKDVMRYKSLWAGNNIPPAQARAEAKTKKESEAALWYEMYEGLKGAIPGWNPPCRGRAYEGFMSRYRPRDIRLGDFDDMLNIFHAVLKREPAVRKTIQSMYDHIMVDEAQDRNEVQAEIIDMISEHIGDGSDGKSLWIVGDDKQSIYSFRGARPDLFSDLNGKEGWKTRMIRTNYRCEPEIVEAANRLIAHNEGQISMEAVPSPHKTRGVGSVVVTNPSDEAEGAIQVASEIKTNLDVGGNVTDNAVLCRTNREIHAYETACILRGIPYARKGVSSFLGSPETNAFLGYIQLVTGTDFEKMQKALGNIINRPNRFFVSPKAGEEAVSGALVDYARNTRADLKHVNPVMALQDRQFQRILAGKLTGSFSGFKFEKAVEQLQSVYSSIAQMQANSADPAYTTKVMFDDILAMNGVVTVTDPNTQRTKYVEQSLRETLQVEMRDSVGDDSEDDAEDEDEETKGLGNIAFLYQLIQRDPTDPGDLADDPNTPAGFKAKIERYAARMKDLRTDITKWDKEQESLAPEKRSPPPGVYLGTCHSTKGAQWANTYVSMPKGKFPFELPKQPGVAVIDDKAQQEHDESERRLAYVALTRAAKSLTVICPKSVGGKAAGISPFVAEAGLVVGQNVQRPGKPIEAPVGEEEPIKTAEVLEWHPEYEETA